MIFHIDIDCFFVSAERIKNPNLNAKPVAVTNRGSENIFFKNKKIDKKSGIITTASYEARNMGIKTTMSVAFAKELEPKLIIVQSDMKYYVKLSRELKEFLQERFIYVEKASIDEFYIDMSEFVKVSESKRVAKELQKEILNKFKLPISIGVAESKTYAKIATTISKPNGVKLLTNSEFKKVAKELRVEKFPHIGKKLTAKLYSCGIERVGELLNNLEVLTLFKAKEIKKRLLGEDKTLNFHKERKSIGISRKFEPIIKREELRRRVKILARHLSFSIFNLKLNPQTFSLTIHYLYSKSLIKSITVHRIATEPFIKNIAIELFDIIDSNQSSSVRGLSLIASNFSKKSSSLFSYEDELKEQKLSYLLMEIRKRYGVDSLIWGSELI